MILNQVKNLLDPARRPQCHPFPLKGRMKPVYTCTPQQTSSVHNRQLPSRRPQSMSGSYRQSTASSSRLNTNKAGEAVLVNNPNALSIEGRNYDTFSSVEDPYIAESHQDIAVKVWLYHHHFL